MWRRRALGGAAAVCCGWMASYDEEPVAESDLPRNWDPAFLEAYWRRRPLHVLSRGIAIAQHLGPLGLKCGVDWCLHRTHENRPVELRETLTSLGPAFIKLGQALSTRPDVAPARYIVELRKLCDAVPEMPNDTALDILRRELGRDPQEFFEDGLDAPVAAASLGQVYRCRLRDSGKVVAVKVQRPDVIAGVALDLTLLRHWARFVEKVKSVLSEQRPYDVALVDSFGAGTWGELDYASEKANQERMAAGLRRASSRRLRNRVVVPEVEIATRKVLVTQWIEGDQLNRCSPETIKSVVPLGVELFMWQLLDFGEYHCDPHPGNLLVDPAGRLALIDFGLCCKIDKPSCRTMTRAVVHLIDGDVHGLLRDAVDLDFLPADVDGSALLPVLQRIFDEARLAEKSRDPRQRRRKEFAAVSDDLNAVFFEYPFRVPEYFALITRALVILEGIAISGDPGFDIFQAAYPHALRRARDVFGDSGLLEIGAAATRARRPFPG